MTGDFPNFLRLGTFSVEQDFSQLNSSFIHKKRTKKNTEQGVKFMPGVVLEDTQDLIKKALKGKCACVARHWTRLWERKITPKWVEKQMKSKDEILQGNFYEKFLKWLYAIEASTHFGSRLLVVDILSRFPITDSRKISPSEFLTRLSFLVGEITALIIAGDKALLKVKVLEGQLLMGQMAESL